MEISQILDALIDAFSSSLNRCEHCGRFGGAADCNFCEQNTLDFSEAITELVMLLEKDPDKRVLLASNAVGRLTAQVQQS